MFFVPEVMNRKVHSGLARKKELWGTDCSSRVGVMLARVQELFFYLYEIHRFELRCNGLLQEDHCNRLRDVDSFVRVQYIRAGYMCLCMSVHRPKCSPPLHPTC